MKNDVPTRERLIESARYLFWERGFAGTSMADLLAHADVNSGSFYHFFESKEALLRAVLDVYLHALRPVIVNPAFAKTDDPAERITPEAIRAYVSELDALGNKKGTILVRLEALTEMAKVLAPRRDWHRHHLRL